MRSTERDVGEPGSVPVSVLGRAMRLLTCFRLSDAELSLAELTRRTAIPKPTAHRMIRELAEWGLVERTGAPGHYRLGMRLFELGQLVPAQRGLREAALPLLGDLHEATHETVHLAVLDGAEVLYVEKLPGRDGPSLPSRVGGRMPAHCTGVGKAMLAFAPRSVLLEVLSRGLEARTPRTIVLPGVLESQLAEIRQRGVAFEQEESKVGIVCAACPVLGEDGSAVAAISITGWSARLNLARVAPAVRTAALALSRQLRGGGPQARSQR